MRKHWPVKSCTRCATTAHFCLPVTRRVRFQSSRLFDFRLFSWRIGFVPPAVVRQPAPTWCEFQEGRWGLAVLHDTAPPFLRVLPEGDVKRFRKVQLERAGANGAQFRAGQPVEFATGKVNGKDARCAHLYFDRAAIERLVQLVP